MNHKLLLELPNGLKIFYSPTTWVIKRKSCELCQWEFTTINEILNLIEKVKEHEVKEDSAAVLKEIFKLEKDSFPQDFGFKDEKN